MKETVAQGLTAGMSSFGGPAKRDETAVVSTIGFGDLLQALALATPVSADNSAVPVKEVSGSIPGTSAKQTRVPGRHSIPLHMAASLFASGKAGRGDGKAMIRAATAAGTEREDSVQETPSTSVAKSFGGLVDSMLSQPKGTAARPLQGNLVHEVPKLAARPGGNPVNASTETGASEHHPVGRITDTGLPPATTNHVNVEKPLGHATVTLNPSKVHENEHHTADTTDTNAAGAMAPTHASPDGSRVAYNNWTPQFHTGSGNAIDSPRTTAVVQVNHPQAPHILGQLVAQQVQTGPGEIRVKVHPEGMGDIVISVVKQGDAVHVHLEANQMQTMQWLAQQSQSLSQAIRSQGVDVSSVAVNFGQASLSSNAQGDQSSSRRQRDGQTSWAADMGRGKPRDPAVRFALSDFSDSQVRVNLQV